MKILEVVAIILMMLFMFFLIYGVISANTGKYEISLIDYERIDSYLAIHSSPPLVLAEVKKALRDDNKIDTSEYNLILMSMRDHLKSRFNRDYSGFD